MAFGRSRFGKKHANPRGTLVWTDNTGVKPAPFAQNLPRYRETHVPEDYLSHLYVGSMWIAKVPMSPDTRTDGSMSVLVQFYYPIESAAVKLNSFLIYAGEIRVEERQGSGRIVSVPRQTFIAAGGRCILTEFSYIAPVT